jgi:ribonucleoside-diphosphate reductase alpha chain/ribonucleoside-triphosphate reductase
MKFLPEKYLNKFEGFPAHMNELGKFVFYRTYSRWLPEAGRRETWKETAARAADYNISLAEEHLRKIGYKPDKKALEREAKLLFENMFNLRQSVSGRTLWVGSSDENSVARKYPLANFNCSFLNIEKWNDLAQLFYLLLVGRM